jgi:hypothetical protein
MSREDESGVKVEGVICIKETEKAILVEGHSLPDGEMWIPKSVVHHDSEVFKLGEEGALVVFEWFAKKEGLD